MKYTAMVDRLVGQGYSGWNVHGKARRLIAEGADVILLTIGDPDFATPAPIVERTIQSLRAGRTHYTPANGELALRKAIAVQHHKHTKKVHLQKKL